MKLHSVALSVARDRHAQFLCGDSAAALHPQYAVWSQAGGVYYVANLEETPLTHRSRFVTVRPAPPAR